MAEDRSILVVGIDGELLGVERDTGAVRWTHELVDGGYGAVQLAANGGQVFASADGDLVYCVDYATGATVWRSQTKSPGRATLLIEPGCLVVAKGASVDCFARGDGTLLWSLPLAGRDLRRCALAFPDNVAQADDAASSK
ncbi:MAG: PQQ-binding-like beta-propeller repeat protein [Polyangiaceae bacterium]|nr:PQQ-binding-like beta-propeller repeat protein [Polyangiaceae bacterium]